MSITIAKTNAGQFIKTMKEYNNNAKPILEKENLFFMGSIALLKTNSIAMVLIYNKFTEHLFPLVTVSRCKELIAVTLYDQLALHKGLIY